MYRTTSNETGESKLMGQFKESSNSKKSAFTDSRLNNITKDRFFFKDLTRSVFHSILVAFTSKKKMIKHCLVRSYKDLNQIELTVKNDTPSSVSRVVAS